MHPGISEASRPLFYLHPQGHLKPKLEIETLKQAMLNPKAIHTVNGISLHPVCFFPARADLMRKQFPELSFVDIQCKDYEHWRKQLNVHKVSLVFATAYANNPASMFGHTFLRLHNKKHHQDDDDLSLIDYSAMFSANVDPGDKGLFYVFKGIFGSYHGVFSLAPYYMKRNTYNYVEGRDLWEYELNLKQDQVDRLIAHLWELYATAAFDYYFFDENCSYYLMVLLEAANPKWSLTKNYIGFVSPQETLQAIANTPHAVNHIRFRPALRRQIKQQLAYLEPRTQSNLHNILNKEFIEDKQKKDQVLMQSLLEYLNYKKLKSGGLKPKFKTLYRQAMMANAKLGIIETDNPLKQSQSQAQQQPQPPHLAHGTKAIGAGALLSSQSISPYLKFSLGFHDLLASGKGLGNEYAINGLEPTFAYSKSKGQEKRLQLLELNIIEIQSLPTTMSLMPMFTWQVRTGIHPQASKYIAEGLALEVEGGLGLSFSLARETQLNFSALVLTKAGKVFDRSYRLAAGARASLLSAAQEKHKWQYQSTIFFQQSDSISASTLWQNSFRLSLYLQRNLDLRSSLKYTYPSNQWQWQVGPVFFF